MPKRQTKLYIEDIQEAIRRIEVYTLHKTFEEFAEDIRTIDAVVRNLMIIGEAVKNIPQDTKSKHDDIPWEEIIGMRNKVIHEYFGVDEDILWETIKEDIPELKKRILTFLDEA